MVSCIFLLFTRTTGAMAQAPMHSPSFSVNLPSPVVSPKSMPSLALRWSARERALQAARQAGADGELVPSGRLQVVHVVEGGDLVNRHRRHAEVAGDEVHDLGGEPALLVLRDDQRHHHRRLLLIGRVFRYFLVYLLQRSNREGHRSMSP